MKSFLSLAKINHQIAMSSAYWLVSTQRGLISSVLTLHKVHRFGKTLHFVSVKKKEKKKKKRIPLISLKIEKKKRNCSIIIIIIS